MPWNKNAGYGLEQIAFTNGGINKVARPAFGRTLYVLKSGTNHPYYDKMVDLLPPDPDGDVRLFSTITAAVAAVENYDTILIGPGNFDEAATISLDNHRGVKIIGCGSGFQWGEGSTNWRDVTSADDLLDISGCQDLEIAGIGFVVSNDGKDAINFDGLNYSVEIHDCNFTGDCGGGAVMAYGINAAGSNGPDLYVHDCRFFRVKTTAIVAGHQRNVIKDCYFVVPASGIGVSIAGTTTASYNAILNCDFLGGNSSDYGIYSAASTAGNWIASNCRFANVAEAISAGSSGSDENVVLCQRDDTGSGGVAGVDPEA